MNENIKFITHYIKIENELIAIGYTQLHARIIGHLNDDFKHDINYTNNDKTIHVEQIAKCSHVADDYVYLYKCINWDTYNTYYFIVNNKMYYKTIDGITTYFDKIIYDDDNMLNFKIDNDCDALIKFAEYIQQNLF